MKFKTQDIDVLQQIRDKLELAVLTNTEVTLSGAEAFILHHICQSILAAAREPDEEVAS